MLHSMDSYEYSQWMAFERANGSLNGEWDQEVMAAIQEQLQTVAYLLGQANFTDKNHKRGPIPKPEHYPRPQEVSLKRYESVVDEIDNDEAEWLPPSEDELLDVRVDPTETGEEEE